jgi:hypothetical protein
LICIAALLAWAFIVATVVAVEFGMGSHMDEVMKRGTRNLEHYIQVRVHDYIESAEFSLIPRLLDHLAVLHLLQRLSGLLEVLYPRVLPSTW